MKLAALKIEELDSPKKAVVQKLRSMGLPTPKTEHYRYFGIRPIFEKDYELALPQKRAIKEGETLTIVDGEVTEAPEGVFVEIVDEVRVDDSHYDQVYYLNHLLSPYVINVEVDEDMELEIVHKFTKNGVFVPYRLQIATKPNIRLTIKEDLVAVSEESLYFYGYDIEIERDTTVRFVSNRITNIPTFTLFGPHSVRVGQNGAFELFTFDLGNAKTIHNFHVTLADRAHSDENHVIFAKEEAKLANTFQIEHRGKESKTTQLSRNILKDHSRGIFDGLLIVKNPAKYASIYQDSKTILLNDGAFMVSKPQMEIYTEYIAEATHGSTTGHLDEEALFYLRQRGIAKEEAKEMLVLSFLNEIFEKLGDEEYKKEFIAIYEENR